MVTNYKKKISAMALLTLGASFLANTANAGLLGVEIFGSGLRLNPGAATIGPGVEFTHETKGLKRDFSDNQLTIHRGPVSSLIAWSGHGDWVFSGFDDLITNVSIASNSGFSRKIVDNFSFTGHSTILGMSDGMRTNYSVLVFDITQSVPQSVPEPSLLVLLSLGLVGLGFRRKNTKLRQRVK